MTAIEVDNLSFSYGDRQVLEKLSFAVAAGRFLAVAGPNGAGKTTLINLLCGLLKIQSGSVKIDGRSLRSYSRRALAGKTAIVKQEFIPVFGFTVAETVLAARTVYYNHLGFESEADRRIVKEALEATDTSAFAARTLGQLSGGERQRVFIARALAQDTGILLLDEPASFLDLKHRVGIYDLLKRAQLEKDKTIVAITHDVNLASQYADEVLLLGCDGSFHFGSSEQILSQERVEELFGVKTFTADAGGRKIFVPLGKFSAGAGPTGGEQQDRQE